MAKNILTVFRMHETLPQEASIMHMPTHHSHCLYSVPHSSLKQFTFRRVYHIVTDRAFWVESIVTYHRIYRKKCITKWRITLSIYYTYLTHDFIKLNVRGRKFHAFSFNSHRNCKIFMTNFNFIFDTICVPYIFRKSIFRWNCDHDTPLCDTPLLGDTPLCDTPDDFQSFGSPLKLNFKSFLSFHTISV